MEKLLAPAHKWNGAWGGGSFVETGKSFIEIEADISPISPEWHSPRLKSSKENCAATKVALQFDIKGMTRNYRNNRGLFLSCSVEFPQNGIALPLLAPSPSFPGD